MQTFDSAALFLAFALVAILVLANETIRWRNSLALALLISLITHFIAEGFRWQMVPCYAACVFIAIWATLQWRTHGHPLQSPKRTKLVRWFTACTTFVMLLTSAFLSIAFPVFDLPAPRGQFPVGTTTLHLIDEDRAEHYTADPNDHRELMVRMWYPAKSIENHERAKYWREPRIRSEAVTNNTPLPWFTFSHLGLVDTHSYWDAPVATLAKPLPIILYSHGIGIGWAAGNTALVEGLASRGYVVVGIDHAYIGSVSIFPDGRLAKFDEASAAAMNQPPAPEMAELQHRLRSSTDWLEHISLYQQAMTLMPKALAKVTEALDTQILDQQFVIAHLERLQRNNADPLGAPIDLNRVGVLGMSLGGSAALEMCAKNSPCIAGVNLDGFHPRHIDLEMDTTPFLFMNREDNLLYNTNYLSTKAPAYSVIIRDITHFNFFDFTIMSPLYKQLGVLGELEGRRMLEITEDYVRIFFDKHLMFQTNSELEDIAKSYPETIFSQRNH